ncbi:MAG: YebC/PmpR family DNA-binding transcriptional regulator [Candidatus Kuenenbacteria bacterium]
MSGHSKWATIKRAKATTDAKRGNLFTKLGNNITVAAKDGSGDINSNFKLRLAIENAKSFNMPKENIERAVKRGTGELKGGVIEELEYGAFLPGQIAVIIKCLTDNKNRTLTDVKTAVQKNGGQMTDIKSVLWQFDNKGVIKINSVGAGLAPAQQKTPAQQGELEEIIINSGADDYEEEEDEWIIYTRSEDLRSVKENLEQAGLKIDSADLEMVAKEPKEADDDIMEKVAKVLAALDDVDEVSEYYTNLK